MKKIITLLMIIMACATMAIAATPATGADKGAKNADVYTFDTLTHDFGTIRAGGGTVSHTFTLTNRSSQPIVITTVTNGGCGCTTPKWTREPIAPGKTGKVTINFNPQGRRGEFNREVRARIESTKKKYTAKITFSGVIVPD